ncbi:hypothetical protein [Singulisphaera sp. PoT]|uniref:hypothetical protein n=1 Tax=Singulisphaera sp. PoT TaxID=3411797 RepID=UPI003BF5FB6B
MRRTYFAALAWLSASFAFAGDGPRVEIRGIYGGVPTEILDQGKTLADYGVNAVWMGSDALSRETIALLRKQGARVFAEFNTMHDAEYLRDHPDAAPIGSDGKPCPPPDDWQGICPTHPGHRRARMDAFRKSLHDFEIDGIWLDYHHAHVSWEQAKPNLPDTCFCPRCLSQFEKRTGVSLPDAPTPERARWLLTQKKADWIRWRCDVFTDWVREFRQIVNQERPKALLGTFHCPWSNADFDGALRDKLAIDLKSQAPYFDVLSPMPYHARFGHADDPAWVGRQVAWLGEYLGIRGKPGERLKIWPIIQLADWGEHVAAADVGTIVEQGTAAPSTGAMVFVWGWLVKDWEKVEALGKAYRALKP